MTLSFQSNGERRDKENYDSRESTTISSLRPRHSLTVRSLATGHDVLLGTVRHLNHAAEHLGSNYPTSKNVPALGLLTAVDIQTKVVLRYR